MVYKDKWALRQWVCRELLLIVLLFTQLPNYASAQPVTAPFDQTFNIQIFGWSKDAGTSDTVSFLVVHKIASINGASYVCGAYRGFPATSAIRRFVHRAKIVSQSGGLLRKGLRRFGSLPVQKNASAFIELSGEARKKAISDELTRAYSKNAVVGVPVSCLSLGKMTATTANADKTRIDFGKMIAEYALIP